MTANDDMLRFLEQAGRYLAQQEDLFGGLLYKGEGGAGSADPSVPPVPVAAPAVAAQAPPAPAAGEIQAEPWNGSGSLDELNAAICGCLKCPLGATRTKFVFGQGNPDASLMFIGEAPGADEDAQGLAFVGRAGQLLTKIIEAIGMTRDEVYICNILKCRPPNNRRPTPEESALCTPYLNKQIELVKPAFIVCLGLTAAQWLLATTSSLGSLRGRFHDYRGIQLLVTYHPAALLRNPEWKKPTWEDMKMLKAAYDARKEA